MKFKLFYSVHDSMFVLWAKNVLASWTLLACVWGRGSQESWFYRFYKFLKIHAQVCQRGASKIKWVLTKIYGNGGKRTLEWLIIKKKTKSLRLLWCANIE